MRSYLNGHLPTWGVGLKPQRHEAWRSCDELQFPSSNFHTIQRLRVCFQSTVLRLPRYFPELPGIDSGSALLIDLEILHLSVTHLRRRALLRLLCLHLSVHYRRVASITSTTCLEKSENFSHEGFSTPCLASFLPY